MDNVMMFADLLTVISSHAFGLVTVHFC